MSKKLFFVSLALLAACGGPRPTQPEKEIRTEAAPASENPLYNPQFSTEVGAGGSGVLCEGPLWKTPYFEILDVYEARKRAMPPALGPTDLPVEKKLDLTLNRLARLSPLRAANYKKRALDILHKKENFFEKGYLPHIGDDDPRSLEDGCRLVQIATRKKVIFEDETEFMIDSKLFKRLDGDNQTALLIHEVAYEEAFERYAQRTSRMSRAFTSLFLSTRMEEMGFREFIEFLAKVDFRATDLGGVQVPTKISANGSAKAGTVQIDGDRLVSAALEVTFHDGDFSIPRQEVDYFGHVLVVGRGIQMKLEFYPDGKLKTIDGLVFAKGEQLIEDRGNQLKLLALNRESLTTFHPSGHFENVWLEKGSKLHLKSESGKLTELETSGRFHIDEQGLAEPSEK